jgi:hypothetical protein
MASTCGICTWKKLFKSAKPINNLIGFTNQNLEINLYIYLIDKFLIPLLAQWSWSCQPPHRARRIAGSSSSLPSGFISSPSTCSCTCLLFVAWCLSRSDAAEKAARRRSLALLAAGVGVRDGEAGSTAWREHRRQMQHRHRAPELQASDAERYYDVRAPLAILALRLL